MRERKRKIFTLTALILSGGLVYGIFYMKTGIAVPCLFFRITGLYCPGCGITRLLTFLMQGKIKDAMESNPALFFLLPVIVGAVTEEMISQVKTGRSCQKTGRDMLLYGIIAILCLYAVIRNMLRIFG